MANTMTIVGNSFTLDFLTAGSGYQLISWRQVTPSYKDGGVFVDSQISPGRRPIYRQDAAIVETIRFGLYATAQTTIAQSLERLRLLSDESFDYWLPNGFIASPVYLKVSVRDEPDFRYAMIYKLEITSELPDLYISEFQSGINVEGTNYAFGMQDITLTIERSPWMSHTPGSGESVTLTTFEDNKVHAHHVPGTSAACVQIGSSAIDGDMPALGKLTVNELGDNPDTIMCGFRSTNRGSNFTAYLNFQASSPSEYDIVLAASSTFAADGQSPTGTSVQHIFASNVGFTDIASVQIVDVPEFKGRFRAFLRFKRSNLGVLFSVKLTLKLDVNSVIVTVYETPSKHVTDVLNSVVIVDMGEISIPASDAYSVSGATEEMFIVVSVDPTAAVTINLHHLVILPIDEYVFDASVYYPLNFGTRSLIVDSVSVPRLLTQGVQVNPSPLEVISVANVVASHPQFIIPVGKQIKLWFFAYYRADQQRVEDIDASISLSAVFRYSTLRRLA